jgi:hypothetical protein
LVDEFVNNIPGPVVLYVWKEQIVSSFVLRMFAMDLIESR